MRPLCRGSTSEVYEYILPRFERQVHVQEVLACACGRGVVTAPPPARVVDRGEYGPGFLAHVVTSRCADATPCTGSVNESNAAAKGAARAEHLLVLATTAALLAVGGVRRLRMRRQAQRPR
ncbi:hypothetical protein ACN6A1_22285 [Myxococcus virescens]|uniref:hypothetical protein n=1 Tax=Myxococcus virescens TaxID=83456 RepID=UPI003DA404CB